MIVVKLVVKHADSRAEAACVTAATLRGLRAGDTSKSSSSDSLLFFVLTKYYFFIVSAGDTPK